MTQKSSKMSKSKATFLNDHIGEFKDSNKMMFKFNNLLLTASPAVLELNPLLLMINPLLMELNLQRVDSNPRDVYN